jgi:hypothetical protein
MRALAAIMIASLSIPAAAVAGVPPPVTTSTTDTDTRAFVGLNWSFGSGGTKPEGIVGLARTKTDSDGDAKGVKAAVHFDFSNGFAFEKLKLTGLLGTNEAQAEIGGGYDFGSGLFGTVGANLPYFALGADVMLSGGIEGYAGIHTLGKTNVPAEAVVILPPPP